MKRGVLVVFLISILIAMPIQASIPYKQSLENNNFKINKVECSDNKLRVLVESRSDRSLFVLFEVYSKIGNVNIFSDKILEGLSADYFMLDTNLQCKELTRLEVNGYDIINSENVVYSNSESPYQFTGSEQQIVGITQSSTIEIPADEPTSENTVSEAPDTNYVYFNNKLISSKQGSKETYYSQDQIGSSTIITDESGNLISHNKYYPFGQDMDVNEGNFKFTGKEQDDSGLYYYGARYYDSSIGRFTNVDPIMDYSQSPYNYVNNNPLINIDPDGREEINSNIITNNANNILGDLNELNIKINYAKNKFGTKPISGINQIIRWLGKDKYISNQILKASKSSNVDPVLLTAVLFKEGLSEYFTKKYISFDVLGPIGLDSFGSEIDYLKEKSYLSKSFKEDENYFMGDKRSSIFNEMGEEFVYAKFWGAGDAIQATASMIAWKRDVFFRDVNRLGLDTSKLSPSEIDAWTYTYYVAGNGRASTLLKKNKLDLSSMLVSSRVGATSQVLRDTKLFEK